MDKPEEKTRKSEFQPHSKSSFIEKIKSRKNVWKWLLVVTVFLVSILISLYFLSPYSLIREISVEGTVEVYDQRVLEATGLQSGDPLWGSYANKKEIEKAVVSANPQVSDASLSFAGINSFLIHINEFETVAYLSTNNQYNKILENGVILDDRTPRPSSDQPILSHFSEGRALEIILDEYVKVDNQVRMLISEIEYVESDRNAMLVHVYMNDGNEVIASIPSFSERINYYMEMARAVNGKKGVFDLEAGAYFIPYSADGDMELDEIEEIEELDDLENIDE